MRMIRLRFLGWLCVLVLALAIPMPVDAGTVYVAGLHNEFGTLDLSTGAFTQIGILNIPSSDGLSGMGFASNGTLYALDSGGIGPNYTAHVWSIDPATAVATDLGDTGQYSVAATVDGNTIYALDSSNPAVLYSVNLSNMNTTVIGTTSFEGDGLMAFDPSGHLFAGEYSFPGDNLWSVNPTTAASTYVGDMNNIMLTGLFIGDTLYAFNPGNDKSAIFTIDTTTGAATQVGTYSLPRGDSIFAAAYLPGAAQPTPEPASLTLLALGGLGLAGYARRRCRQVSEAS